ncbi:MAG: hypothetical protein OEV06_01915 [Anaerolineae bacterium]|nr:hypothetical protein [Anaerolineae bacterium]
MISKDTFGRLEANFWSSLVSLLDQSSTARKLTPELYRMVHTNKDFAWLATGFLLAFAGLALGYATGTFLRFF